MIELETLTDARGEYERVFAANGLGIHAMAESLPDRDLLLSGHVIVLNDGARRLQISVDEEAIPCAFLKKIGVDDEATLLQIIVSDEDLFVDECSALVSSWLTNEDDAVVRLATDFPGSAWHNRSTER